MGPIWITKELVIAIHKRQLAEHGGAEGLRDENLLDSALGRPRNLFAYEQPTPGIPALAAANAFAIAKNHAFIDGNKRTAYVVCRTFLLLNGYDMTAGREQRYQEFLDLAAGSVSESDLINWLKANCGRSSSAGRSPSSFLLGRQ